MRIQIQRHYNWAALPPVYTTFVLPLLDKFSLLYSVDLRLKAVSRTQPLPGSQIVGKTKWGLGSRRGPIVFYMTLFSFSRVSGSLEQAISYHVASLNPEAPFSVDSREEKTAVTLFADDMSN